MVAEAGGWQEGFLKIPSASRFHQRVSQLEPRAFRSGMSNTWRFYPVPARYFPLFSVEISSGRCEHPSAPGLKVFGPPGILLDIILERCSPVE